MGFKWANGDSAHAV